MSKKTLFVSLILFSLLFSAMTNVTFADAQSLMKQADGYNDKQHYYQAKQIYQTIVADYSHTDYALAAQRKLVCVNIALDNYSQADTEFNKLITNFAGNVQLPAQIHKIGFICRTMRKYQQAVHYYEYVVKNFPTSDQAIFSQKDIVKAAIEAEDYTGTQQALDKLKTKFANHPALPEALYDIVDCYTKEGRYDKANELNEYIISNFSNSEQALWVRKDFIKSYMVTGNVPDTDVDAAIEKLKNDFSSHSGLPKALIEIARECRASKVSKHGRAIELYQYILSQWPNSDNALESQKLIAKVGIERNDFAAVDGAVAKLLGDFSSNSGLAKAVYDLGECCYAFGKYERANQFYQQALGRNLNAKYAMRSQKRLVQANIKLGNYTVADAAISKLRSDYSSYGDLPDYLCDVADCYRKSKKYEKANESYQYVLDHWSNDKQALRAQKNIVKSNITLGNETAADAAFAKLLSDFSGDGRMSQAVCSIADSYRKSGKYEKAIQLYQYSLDHWPEHNLAIFSQRGLVIANIYLGDDSKAKAEMEKLITTFSSSTGLPTVVYQIGEEYYSRALEGGIEDPNARVQNYLSNAIAVWQRIIEVIPASASRTVKAYFYSAICYDKLGEYTKAIEHYEQVVEKYPDYEHAWNAQFKIGLNYEKLAKSGAVSKSEAQAKIKAAYQKLLVKYPDCKAARAANSWLIRYSNTK